MYDTEEWNRQKQLIDAVQKETCLYDAKHADYLNIKLKESIWKRIALELNFKGGNEAKRAWEKLRNNHRDALRRQKQLKQKGAGAAKIKRWRFQEDMAFILPHMSNKTHSYTRDDNTLADEPSPLAGHSGTRKVYTESIMIDNDSTTDEEADSPRRSSTDTSTDQAQKRKRQKKISSEPSNRNDVRQHRIRDGQAWGTVDTPTNDFTVHNVKNDPLFHFFISMYETTKALPRRTQHGIKTKIFSLVSHAEYETFYPPQHSDDTVVGDAATDASFISTAVKQQPIEYFPEEAP